MAQERKTADPRLVARLEELTLNAWPSPRQLLIDGWVLREAGGYTRRANSVHPLHAGARDVDEKVAACEAAYRRAGLRTTFKLTPASDPPGLDALLRSRGYAEETGAAVQVLDLSTLDAAPPAPGRSWDAPDHSWTDAYARFNAVPPPHHATLRWILHAIALPTHYVAIYDDGDEADACAVGLAVHEDDWVGLYDIAVRPDRRRRGVGRRLIASLLAWGKANGARRAYLQVAVENEPAKALYAGFGFREAYQYRYFVRSAAG